MNVWIEMIAPLLGGVLLGIFYFVGLWWTVKRLSRTEHPVTLYLLSFGLRVAVLLLAFFLLLNFGVLELMVALAGFIVTRFVLVRCLGLAAHSGVKPGSHSPIAGPTKTGAG